MRAEPEAEPETPLLPPAPRLAPGRLALLLAAFVGLILCGVWLAAPSSAALLAALGRIPLAGLLLASLLALGLLAADLLRYRVFGSALGVRVPFRVALDATIANNFFAWITPGSAMADPAAIYMLGRGGVPWDAAALISLGKAATGIILSLGATALLLAIGLGPPINQYLGWLLVSGAGAISVSAAALCLGAFRPQASAAWLRRFAGDGWRGVFEAGASAVERLGAYRAAGAPGWGRVLGAHALYYGCFIGALVCLAASLGAGAGLVPTAVIYQGFTYLAPTPGGAGLAEGLAGHFFNGLLSPADALAVALVFRGLTFYLHILVGLLYLPAARRSR